jgi:hypothetical protein
MKYSSLKIILYQTLVVIHSTTKFHNEINANS